MSAASSSTRSALSSPHEALAALLARLNPVAAERLPLERAAGRVLAEPVRADRPSPACDVSAMDGYAVRLADLALGKLPVAGEVVIGQAPPRLPPGQAVRIFTGGAVPTEAEAVIPRENITESLAAITLPAGLSLQPGANIRRAGENLLAGETVIEVGQAITPAVVAALATFGQVEPLVYRPVRVSVLTTGDEVLPPSAAPSPWQLRDSNGPFLRGLLGGLPWVDLLHVQQVRDDPTALQHALGQALGDSDAVLLTGGVSMGDHDHVPDAVRQAGSEVVFHKLAIRPGKPMLGAVGPAGQAILGLPGNPVSVMVTARRFAVPALRKLAGYAVPETLAATVELTNPDDKVLGLWWYRPVRLISVGQVECVPSKGSGDVVSAARSDGVIEMPPQATDRGPWPFYPWTLD